MPADNETHRKLAAILSADAVGYSRLMQADEPATVETLNAYRAAMRRIIERHEGRVVNTPGEQFGFEVRVAGNGREALELLESLAPDLVVLAEASGSPPPAWLIVGCSVPVRG